MQILQWLSKISQEPPKTVASSGPIEGVEEQNIESREIVVFNDRRVKRRRLKRVEHSKLNSKNFSIFCFLQRKDVSKACFYHTLDLRRLGSFQKKQQHSGRPMKIMKKEEIGNKVLPITESTQSSSSRNEKDQCLDSDKRKEKTEADKTKAVSRMKELMKWAAAGEKGGQLKFGRKALYFNNKAALKTMPDENQLSNDSPKISFRWDWESRTTTSTISTISKASSFKNDGVLSTDMLNSTPSDVGDECAGRTGNWITTDSEFVVLEL